MTRRRSPYLTAEQQKALDWSIANEDKHSASYQEAGHRFRDMQSLALYKMVTKKGKTYKPTLRGKLSAKIGYPLISDLDLQRMCDQVDSFDSDKQQSIREYMENFEQQENV